MRLNLKQTRLREDFSRVWEQPGVLGAADPSFLLPGVEKKGVGWETTGCIRASSVATEEPAGRRVVASSTSERVQSKEEHKGGKQAVFLAAVRAHPLRSVKTNRTWAEPRTTVGSARLSGVKPATPPNPPSTPPTDEGRTTCTCSSSSSTAIAPRFFCHWLRPLLPLQSPPPISSSTPISTSASCLLPPSPTMLVDGGLGRRRLLRSRSSSRKVERCNFNRCTNFSGGGKKAACQANSDPHTASSGRGRGRAGPGQARPGRARRGRLSSAALHKLHTVSLLERQTPFSKHNKAASAFLQFTSIEETEVSLQMNNLLRIGHI